MRRGLGKGLTQLLGESVSESAPTSLPIGSIHPNSRQPRRHFDEDSLKELADSIRIHGVIQPLIVRASTEGEFELIAGERRLRASVMAGLKEVPVVVRSASAQNSLEIALIENVQREDISALECAFAYRRLIDEFSLTQEEVATKVGKSRASIANTVRILRLPEEIQEALQLGQITEGHARALLMSDSPLRQMQIFQKILRDGISVRDTERLARMETAPPSLEEVEPVLNPADANWKAVEKGLSERFGTLVRIKRKGEKGKVEMDFGSVDDLNRILDLLGFHMD